MEENDILFIDEIHRLNTSVEEILYPAMEDGELDIIIGKGPSAKSIRIELPPFTLIGATTRAGLLSSPLRDRFGVTHRMEYYTDKDLVDILIRGAKVLQVGLEEEGALEIAKRSRGTPRIANRFLKRVRDYAEIKGDGVITKSIVTESLKLLGVDQNLIGATTRAGLLSSPLRDRFGVTHRMEYYTDKDLVDILIRGAKVLQVGLEEEGALEIAKRSRGTPRIANRFLKRVRDYAEIKGDGVITKSIVTESLKLLGVDQNGLDELDRGIIVSMLENYNGGPVGIETLSLLLGEDKRTIEEVYEPYLVKIGYIKRTPRGRVVTEKGREHFKIKE